MRAFVFLRHSQKNLVIVTMMSLLIDEMNRYDLRH